MAKKKETRQKIDTKKPKQIAKNKPAPKTRKTKGIYAAWKSNAALSGAQT